MFLLALLGLRGDGTRFVGSLGSQNGAFSCPVLKGLLVKLSSKSKWEWERKVMRKTGDQVGPPVSR